MVGNEMVQSIIVEQDELGTPALFTNVDDDGFYLSFDFPEKETRLFSWKEVVQILLVVSRVMCEIVHAQILKEWKVMAYFPYRV